MSALDHLHAVARGVRPDNDGLLGNTRCSWGRNDIVGEEAILAEFAARPLVGDTIGLAVETAQSAVVFSNGGALVADLYDGRAGRLWRIGGSGRAVEPAVDVAFDPDMHQERGGLFFRAEDHPELDPAAAEVLLAAAHDLIAGLQAEGNLRVRGFVVRAFGDAKASAALLSLYVLDNETPRSASFSYAVVGADAEGVRTVRDALPPRDWTPRL